MKKKEIKKLTKEQALKDLEKLKKDLFNFRFQKVNGQVKSPAKINETKKTMKEILTDIQTGKFAREWMLENKVNQTSFKAIRNKNANHPIEEVGEKLRSMMPWIGSNKLVDKGKN